MRTNTIKDKFLTLFRRYSDNEEYNAECWTEIETKYSSKKRYYHNLMHLENMLDELDQVESQVKDLDTTLFTIYYHDIIYDATKNDNEHQSALLFEKRIAETTFVNIAECMAQIESTKEHMLSLDNDTNILLDLDLSILGQSPKEYQQYCENIRMEYHIYPDVVYRNGRKEVLKSLLELDSIYKTDYFKQKYENQAKLNMRLELDQLNK